MTPKEKALQLIDAFDEYAESRISDDGRGFDKKYCSKQCALIAVDEILNVLPQQEYLEDRGEYSENRERIYWKEVKQEINKL
jgi:hypothetical protein